MAKPINLLWLAMQPGACKVLGMESTLDQSRQDQLSDFASRYLPDSIAFDGLDPARALPGDAGFRRYFRWSSCPEVLGVDAPPESEDSLAFVRVADLLRGLGVNSPQVFAADLRQGLLLVENLGEESYQDALIPENAPLLYQQALDSLLKIQSCSERPAWLPLYSSDLLRQEMSLFLTWFVHQLLGHELTVAEDELVNQVFDHLIDASLAQPQVLTHRDYHCRNLIVTKRNNPGVIDFQDAVWGPVTYDLASLMRDCYLRWTPERIAAELDKYVDGLVEQAVIEASQVEAVRSGFDPVSLQRHLKVLGIFSRLWLRDNKAGYLADLPLVLRYVLETATLIEAARPLAEWIETTLVPLAEQQEWYRDWRTAGDDKTIW